MASLLTRTLFASVSLALTLAMVAASAPATAVDRAPAAAIAHPVAA